MRILFVFLKTSFEINVIICFAVLVAAVFTDSCSFLGRFRIMYAFIGCNRNIMYAMD